MDHEIDVCDQCGYLKVCIITKDVVYGFGYIVEEGEKYLCKECREENESAKVE